jgi:putative oxidoreductase
MKLKPIAGEVLICLLILLFIYASLSKLLDFYEYRKQLYNQAFPAVLKPMLLWTIPVSELLLTALLIIQSTRTVALYGSLVLLALFTGYIGLVKLHMFHRVPCSCGGVLRSLNWTQHLFFNIAFIVINIAAILLQRKSFHHLKIVRS